MGMRDGRRRLAMLVALVDAGAVASVGVAALVVDGAWLGLAVCVAVAAAVVAHWAVLTGPMLGREPAATSALTWYELAARALGKAARAGVPVAVMLMHVDGWRPLRHRIGLDGCVRVLGAVAEALRGQVGDDDLVGQFDGDADFAVLLIGVDRQGLVPVVDRLREAVRGLAVELDGETVRGLTVSVGCATFPDNARTLSELVLAADNAMFAAKVYVGDQVRVSRMQA